MKESFGGLMLEVCADAKAILLANSGGDKRLYLNTEEAIWLAGRLPLFVDEMNRLVQQLIEARIAKLQEELNELKARRGPQ